MATRFLDCMAGRFWSSDGGRGTLRAPMSVGEARPVPPQPSWRDGGSTSYLLTGSGLIVLLLIGVAVALFTLRANTLNDTRRATWAVGRALAEQSARSLQAVDLALLDTVARLQLAGADTPQPFGLRMGAEDIFAMLRERLRSLPQVDAMTVIDRRGRVMNTTQSFPPPAVAVGGMEFYDFLRDHDTTEAYIGAALATGPTDGFMLVARRINDTAGQFAGVVVGTLSLQYFEEVFSAVNVQRGSAVALVRRNGQVLAQFPRRLASQAGAEQPLQDLEWDAVMNRGGGTYRVTAELYGPAQLVSAHILGSYPLAVRVSVTEQAALARWRQQAVVIAAGSLVAAACMALLLRIVVQQLKTLRRSRTALSQRNTALEQASVRMAAQAADLAITAEALTHSERREAENALVLQTTLENIDQGLLMIDADLRVAVYNQRLLEIMELPPALLASKPLFAEILDYQRSKQEFANADPAVFGFVERGGLVDRKHTYERTRLNGQAIEVRSLPLPAGGLVRTYTDITERKAAEARTRFIAHHDGLTLLANRVLLQDHLKATLATCAETGHGMALLYLDLDRFKPINDTYGHAVGDQLLIEVAQRMRGIVREEDLVARMGGDEFAIVQTMVGQPEAASFLAERLLARIAEPFMFNGLRLGIGISIGIALYPGSGLDAAELRRKADVALYRAKEGGRSTFRFFDAAMDARQQARYRMEQDVRDAIGLQSFHLHYQPIVSTHTGAIVGFESLLRWTHPTRGAVSPEEFVTLAELSGLIVPLGRWVIETACAEAVQWDGALRVAVNMSPLQFRQGNLVEEVTSILRRTGLPAERLELEVTEGVLLEENPQVLQTIYGLQSLGVSITLDDFGTGHASLSYLRRFPFDKIKIDKSFVRNLREDRQSRAIVEAVLLLSDRLELQVVAEGVETAAQLDILRELGCPLVQGFLTGHPMAAADARLIAQMASPGPVSSHPNAEVPAFPYPAPTFPPASRA